MPPGSRVQPWWLYMNEHYELFIFFLFDVRLTRDPLGYSAIHAPVGVAGGSDSAPRLTSKPLVIKRRENGVGKL